MAQIWIYKTTYPQTITIRPTTVTGVTDASGNLILGSQMKLKAIQLRFENCHCFVDEIFAKKNSIKLDDLIRLIEANPGYETNFWCIQNPEKEATKKELKEVEESGKGKIKVKQGVRN